MLSAEQLSEYGEKLNHAIDMLQRVSTDVRHVYPPDEIVGSIVRNASDAITGIQDMRSKLGKLRHRKQNPIATDLSELYRELERRVLSLDGVEAGKPWKGGYVPYKAPDLMKSRFVQLRLGKNVVTVGLYIRANELNDPRKICKTPRNPQQRRTSFHVRSTSELNYAMELIQHAYDYNTRRSA